MIFRSTRRGCAKPRRKFLERERVIKTSAVVPNFPARRNNCYVGFCFQVSASFRPHLRRKLTHGFLGSGIVKRSRTPTGSSLLEAYSTAFHEAFCEDYYYLYGKRMRSANETNELVRSGRFRVSGWNPDGSERLMPVAPDNLEWVAWDSIRSRQDRQNRQVGRQERKRLEAQLGDDGREAKRARFGDG